MTHTWNVILYCYTGDHDGDRTLIGPFVSLREAEEARLRFSDYGDAEIRRVCSVDAVQSALDRIVAA